jgi:hypothetical protein
LMSSDGWMAFILWFFGWQVGSLDTMSGIRAFSVQTVLNDLITSQWSRFKKVRFIKNIDMYNVQWFTINVFQINFYRAEILHGFSRSNCGWEFDKINKKKYEGKKPMRRFEPRPFADTVLHQWMWVSLLMRNLAKKFEFGVTLSWRNFETAFFFRIRKHWISFTKKMLLCVY